MRSSAQGARRRRSWPKLNAAAIKAMSDAAVQARLRQLGASLPPRTSARRISAVLR